MIHDIVPIPLTPTIIDTYGMWFSPAFGEDEVTTQGRLIVIPDEHHMFKYKIIADTFGHLVEHNVITFHPIDLNKPYRFASQIYPMSVKIHTPDRAYFYRRIDGIKALLSILNCTDTVDTWDINESYLASLLNQGEHHPHSDVMHSIAELLHEPSVLNILAQGNDTKALGLLEGVQFMYNYLSEIERMLPRDNHKEHIILNALPDWDPEPKHSRLTHITVPETLILPRTGFGNTYLQHRYHYASDMDMNDSVFEYLNGTTAHELLNYLEQSLFTDMTIIGKRTNANTWTISCQGYESHVRIREPKKELFRIQQPLRSWARELLPKEIKKFVLYKNQIDQLEVAYYTTDGIHYEYLDLFMFGLGTYSVQHASKGTTY